MIMMPWTWLMLILVSFFLVISSSSWFVIWLFLELNLFSFLIFLMYSNTWSKHNYVNKKLSMINPSMKYFLMSVFSSFVMLIGVTLSYSNFLQMGAMLIMFSLLIKIGVIPLHSWLVAMSLQMDVLSFVILLTVQKFAPLFILPNLTMISSTLALILMISTILSSLLVLLEKNLFLFLVYSSINNSSWLVLLSCTSLVGLSLFLSVYTLLMLSLGMKILYSDSNFHMMNLEAWMNMMSIGGLPPLSGFLIKLVSLVIFFTYSVNMLLLLIFMMSALMMFFVYLTNFINTFWSIFKSELPSFLINWSWYMEGMFILALI